MDGANSSHIQKIGKKLAVEMIRHHQVIVFSTLHECLKLFY